MKTKICTKCKKELLLTSFYKGNDKNDLTFQCKKCSSERGRKYREEHREEINVKQRIYHQTHKEIIYSKNKHCKCGKAITNNAKKCGSCAKKGVNASNFVDGRTNKKYYCMDCKTKISGYRVKRCVRCQGIRLSKQLIKDGSRRGIKNSNSKGGFHRIRRPRDCFDYKNWRRKVFERDDYTCIVCGNHGYRLDAHHIKSWKNNVELRYKVKNGKTLCVKCHKKLHHELGRE